MWPPGESHSLAVLTNLLLLRRLPKDVRLSNWALPIKDFSREMVRCRSAVVNPHRQIEYAVRDAVAVRKVHAVLRNFIERIAPSSVIGSRVCFLACCKFTPPGGDV